MHWDWTDHPSNLRYKNETLIEEHLVRRIDVSGPTFKLLKCLFASICFHYEHLDAHLHPNHRLRAPQIYIASGREKYFQKYSVIRYPWLSTNYNPYTTGIYPNESLRNKQHIFSWIGERNFMLEVFVETYIKRDVFWTKSNLLMNHSWESFKIY